MKFLKVNNPQQEWEHLTYSEPLRMIEQMLQESTEELDACREAYRHARNEKMQRRLLDARRRVETLTDVMIRMMDFYSDRN